MKKTINVYEFIREFEEYGRGEQFSRNGLIALFEYLEEYEESACEQIELDVIGLCCDYTEYQNFEEIKKEYQGYFEDNYIEDYEDLKEYTQVIDCNGSIIIQNI